MTNRLEDIAFVPVLETGVIGLDAVRPYIKAEPISRLTDDELLARASTETDSITWDNLADYGYGVPEGDLSVDAWRKRFDYEFSKTLHKSDDFIGEPDAFVEAIWRSQRMLPTVGEYAKQLSVKGMLKPEEVAIAQRVSEIEAMKDSLLRHEAMDQMGEDEQWTYNTVRNKLEYYINLHPASPVAQGDIIKQAEAYAWKCARGLTSTKDRVQAHRLLLEARGVLDFELDNTPEGAIPRKYKEYRLLGIHPKYAVDLAESGSASLFRPWSDVNTLVHNALSGDLNTQLAIRQYFGIGNFVELMQYQAKLDALSASRKDVAYRFVGAGLVGANFDVDSAFVKELQNPFDIEVPNSTFREPVFTTEESEKFETMARFVVHEPALRDYLLPVCTRELMAQYTTWLDAQAEN